jgi:hypothetical protein
MDGWKLTVSSLDGNTVAWLTNDAIDAGFYESEIQGELLIDLARIGYVPTVYHDGGDAPPLVVFHAAQRNLDPYVWEPASGRIYRAGGPGSEYYSRTNNG